MRKNLSEVEEPPSKEGKTVNAYRASINPSSGNKKESDNDSSSGLWKRIRQRLVKAILRNPRSLEEDVADLIEEHDPEGEKLGDEERELVNNILSLGEKTVHHVMVPRADIIAAQADMNLSQLKKMVIEFEHTRMPVYKDTLDQVIGFLHIKDIIPLFGSPKEFKMSKLIREILYVPPSMKIMDLLVRMQERRVHIAIVLDEYGGTEGLVTMEDIVEEIVGEIEDEHDDIGESDVIIIDDQTFQVKARMNIDEFEEKLNISLEENHDDEDFGTVGGFLFYLLGRVPEKGEQVEHASGLLFEILEADPRRIKKVLVRKLR